MASGRFGQGSAMQVLLSVTAVTMLISCGSSSTAPPAAVAGDWDYSAPSLTGGGVTCSTTATMHLTTDKAGNTFTGDITAGILVCSRIGAAPDTVSLAGHFVTSGSVDGSAVNFDIDTPDYHNSGTVTGGSMTGGVTFKDVLGSTTYDLSGNFTAKLQ